MENLVDLELVRKAQAGNRKAFGALVMKYQHRIVHVVNGFVHDPVEALDITQEVFIKAYLAIVSFRGESSFYVWLYRITVNTSKNYLVSRAKKPPATDIDAMDVAEFYDIPELKEMITPENNLMRDQLADVINQAITDLPEENSNGDKITGI